MSPDRILYLLNQLANVDFSYPPIGHGILDGLVNHPWKECP